MAAHLKKTWKLIVCSGLLIYFIRCSAIQVKMDRDQQGNTSSIRMKDDPVPTANPTSISDAFNGINGNSVIAKHTIHKGLYNLHTGFFKKLGAFYWLESNTNKEPELLIKDINLALRLLNNLYNPKLVTCKDKIKFFLCKSHEMLHSSTSTISDFLYWSHTYITAMKELNTLNDFNLNNNTIDPCTRDCCQSQQADQHPIAAMEPLQSLLDNEKEKNGV